MRGLDYYSKTVFEFVSDEIGSQGTVCGGGRYDGLVEELGGNSTPAIGFAAGIERLMLLMENSSAPFPEADKPVIYLAGMDDESRAVAFKIATQLRLKGLCAEIDHMGRSVKAQLKYADKTGAKFVAVIGEEELKTNVFNVKNMADGTVCAVKREDIYSYLLKEKK